MCNRQRRIRNFLSGRDFWGSGQYYRVSGGGRREVALFDQLKENFQICRGAVSPTNLLDSTLKTGKTGKRSLEIN